MAFRKSNIIDIKRGLKQSRLFKSKLRTPKNFASGVDLLIPDSAFGDVEAASKIEEPSFFYSEGQGFEVNPDEIEVSTLQIDTSSGTATSYGSLSGAVDGSNTVYTVSNGSYETGTSQVYWNMQEQIRGVDYTESSAGAGEVTFTTAPLSGTVVTVSYHKSNRLVDIRYATTETGTDKLLIAGLLNSSNKVFAVPGPYVTGTLKVFYQGAFQHNGSDQDVTETTPATGTFTMDSAPDAGDVISATFVPAIASRFYETTNDTLSYTFNGTNTRGTTSFPYKPCSLEISVQGILLTPGNGLTETDPANGYFDTETAWSAGGVLSAAYGIGSNADSVRNPVTGIAAKTANYTVSIYDSMVKGDATSGNITITLPAVADATGMIYDIKKIDSSVNTVTIATPGAETIDGAVSYVIRYQHESIPVKSDGSNWWVQ